MLRFILAATLLAVPAFAHAQTDPYGGQRVRAGAELSGKTTEVLVSNAVATAMPTTPLAGRKAVELQNLGPNAIHCTVDGTAPVATKARRVDAGGTWSLDAGDKIAIRCIASTAAQVTGAATIVTELR